MGIVGLHQVIGEPARCIADVEQLSVLLSDRHRMLHGETHGILAQERCSAGVTREIGENVNTREDRSMELQTGRSAFGTSHPRQMERLDRYEMDVVLHSDQFTRWMRQKVKIPF